MAADQTRQADWSPIDLRVMSNERFSGLMVCEPGAPFQFFIDGRQVARAEFLKWLSDQPEEFCEEITAALALEPRPH